MSDIGESTSARDFLPARLSLPALRDAAGRCRGCPLYRNATRTVFGEGRAASRIEDLRGAPFVGPAGRILDEGLAAAGIARADAYVTNMVKHFKWVPKGNRRMHKTPGAREISACLPWLEKEIELIEPDVLVSLGASGAARRAGSR